MYFLSFIKFIDIRKDERFIFKKLYEIIFIIVIDFN